MNVNTAIYLTALIILSTKTENLGIFPVYIIVSRNLEIQRSSEISADCTFLAMRIHVQNKLTTCSWLGALSFTHYNNFSGKIIEENFVF